MKLEILVGMIASGKSTYARHRAKEGALIVCHDDLTAMLHAEYRYEQGLRECYRTMEERLAYCGLSQGRDVVIDRTHLTRESRKRWVDFAANRGSVATVAIPVEAVAFPIQSAEVHARRRWADDARARELGDWLTVAEHHAAQAVAEPLCDDEGFARIVRLSPILTVNA